MKLIERWIRASLLLAVPAVGWLSGCGVPDSPRDLTTLHDSTATVDILESSTTCESCINVERIVVLGDTIGPGYINWSIYVALDDAGNYWVGQQQEGLMKIWDTEGRFLRAVGRKGDGPMEFYRPAPMRTDSDGRMHVVDLDTGRETVVNADFSYYADRTLQIDDQQRLWVIISVLKDDWQDHMEERVMPNGRIAYGPIDDDPRQIYQSRIDLIDFSEGSLIATGRHDPLLEAFVPGWISLGEFEFRTVLPSDDYLESYF